MTNIRGVIDNPYIDNAQIRCKEKCYTRDPTKDTGRVWCEQHECFLEQDGPYCLKHPACKK